MNKTNDVVDQYVDRQKKAGHGFEQASWDQVKENIPEVERTNAEHRAKEALKD